MPDDTWQDTRQFYARRLGDEARELAAATEFSVKPGWFSRESIAEEFVDVLFFALWLFGEQKVREFLNLALLRCHRTKAPKRERDDEARKVLDEKEGH